MKHRPILSLALAVFLPYAVRLSAQETPPDSPEAAPTAPAAPAPRPAAASQPRKPEQLQSFKFEGADLDTVMTQYCDWTGKIYLKNDAVKATVTLKADRLTVDESVEVVNAILAMNGIALVPMGEKFVKVVQANAPDLGGQGLPTNLDPAAEYGGAHKLVTQIIHLKNVTIPDVQTAVQHLMNAFGKIQTLERSNSLLITDTEANILRIRELVDFVDQAAARIEPHIYQIQHAEAADIAAKLNEIIQIAQADQKQPAGAAPLPVAGVRAPPGVIRASVARDQPAAPTQATITRTEGSSTVMIQGTVKVLADERTNIILVFSQEENFPFFDKIIQVLDVEVAPTITFEVVNLEYADAEELSGTLNELVGAAQGSARPTTSGSSSGSRSGSSRAGSTQRPAPSAGLGSQMVTPNAGPEGGTPAIENLSKLSESTRILSDKRSNSILLMGQRADIAAIKNVIKSLDIMLGQVLIEAAIFEVSLGDELRHGIDWLYRGANKLGAWDGQSLVNSTNGLGTVAAGALTYYQSLTGIDTQIAINLAASDSNVRLLATPVIMTTDNTEARLSVGEQRPVVTSTDSFGASSGTLRSSYQYKDIGIQLTVTPRINPQRVVVMEIVQKADQVGENIRIDNNEVPIIRNREFEASVAVPDRGTIALGGLINSEVRDTVSKIPILGDIPLLGRYLFSSVSQQNRQTELVVLMTPYVLTTHDEMLKETERVYDATDMTPADWPSKAWSGSSLQFREPVEPIP